MRNDLNNDFQIDISRKLINPLLESLQTLTPQLERTMKIKAICKNTLKLGYDILAGLLLFTKLMAVCIGTFLLFILKIIASTIHGVGDGGEDTTTDPSYSSAFGNIYHHDRHDDSD